MQLKVIEYKEGTIKMRASLRIPSKSMDDIRNKVAALIADGSVISPKPVEG